MEELAGDPLFVAIKESSDDIRRSTEIINRFGDRYRPVHRRRQSRLRGAGGRRDRLGGRAGHRLPARDGGDLPIDAAGPPRRGAGHLPLVPAAARPRRVDLSGPEHQACGSHAIGTNDRVRMPRQPLSGERRKAVEKIVKDALAVRPVLPKF